jgi:hypothetical protein
MIGLHLATRVAAHSTALLTLVSQQTLSLQALSGTLALTVLSHLVSQRLASARILPPLTRLLRTTLLLFKTTPWHKIPT